MTILLFNWFCEDNQIGKKNLIIIMNDSFQNCHHQDYHQVNHLVVQL